MSQKQTAFLRILVLAAFVMAPLIWYFSPHCFSFTQKQGAHTMQFRAYANFGFISKVELYNRTGYFKDVWVYGEEKPPLWQFKNHGRYWASICYSYKENKKFWSDCVVNLQSDITVWAEDNNQDGVIDRTGWEKTKYPM